GDVVGEHDDLVDPRSERADLRGDDAEGRVLRVDLLGDEDEAAHTKSRSPSSKCGRPWRGSAGSRDLPRTASVRHVGAKPASADGRRSHGGGEAATTCASAAATASPSVSPDAAATTAARPRFPTTA